MWGFQGHSSVEKLRCDMVIHDLLYPLAESGQAFPPARTKGHPLGVDKSLDKDVDRRDGIG